MKRYISIVLTALMILSCCTFAFAATSEAESAANELYSMGLFHGTGKNKDGTPIFDLDKAPTRYEAVTMLVRLLGKESTATAQNWTTPFADVVKWAKPYVGYAYNNSLTNGVSSVSYGGDQTVNATQYLTFVLRALNYESGVDFQWNKAWELSDKIGLTDGRYNANTKTFTRGDVAIISRNALQCHLKDSSVLLKDTISFSPPTPTTSNTSIPYDVFADLETILKDYGDVAELALTACSDGLSFNSPYMLALYAEFAREYHEEMAEIASDGVEVCSPYAGLVNLKRDMSRLVVDANAVTNYTITESNALSYVQLVVSNMDTLLNDYQEAVNQYNHDLAVYVK